jgi:DNA-binding response OmpR family regulator
MTHKLLLLEDEEHLAYALEFNLTQEGYAVDVASSLERARELVRGRYDLLILDVMLPDGTGFELCEELRKAGDLTPILFLTAKGATDDIVAGLDAGGDDYMVKPFSLQELLGRVAAMLRRRGWDAEASPPSEGDAAREPLRFGECTVDFSTREASKGAEPVELTDLEVRLVRFFADHAGRVVSRQELLEKVWGVSRASNTRTVDIFLVRLRRAFERDPARPRHFLTVRGVGYRFVPEP